MPVSLTSPTPTAMPRPCQPRQPRLKPVSCQRPSSPRQPGMIGLPGKWHSKNQRSGWMSNSATTWPLPCAPPSAEMSVILSIISIGGRGSCALPGQESSPLGALPSGQTSSAARTPRARATDTRDGSSGGGEWPPSPLRKTIVNRGRSTLYCAPMAQEISYSDTGDLGATWLASAGLRPTRQRVALAELLVGDGRNRHVTAESLYAASREAGDGVSLATVYNTLRAFCDAGLMREITVDGSKSYFDTRIDDHPHFYWEEDGRLTDAPATDLEITRLPDAPNGAEVASVDVVIRLRKSG